MSTKPIVQYVEQFTVTGFCTRTQNSDEISPTTAKIPLLWKQFFSSDQAKNHAAIFGVYSDYESDANGFYTITAGVSLENAQQMPHTVNIQSGNYLVFSNKGPMPTALIDTWKQIWSYFADAAPYQRSFISDFELYSGAEEVSIYIGIQSI